MNKDDIKLIISLSGQKRLPDLEKEIFVNEELTAHYLYMLSTSLGYTEHEFIVYHYARDIMKERWIAAEHLIISSGAAYGYARDVIKGRWLEKETIIKSNDIWNSLYSTILFDTRSHNQYNV